MGLLRLRAAAWLLGAFSVLTTALAAPVAFNLAAQPDSASAVPGGNLEVVVEADPAAGWNVTAVAADGSWDQSCTTDADGRCVLDLVGTKGTVSVAGQSRAFFLPDRNEATWTVAPGGGDDGAPLGLGPRDALPLVLVSVASLFGLAAALALYRRTALRLAVLGVGLTLLAHVLVFQPVGVAVGAFAGYALVKDGRLFGAVPLDDVDRGEEEE